MNTNGQDDYFKIILIGDSGVGKTMLISRLISGNFNKNLIKFGIDYVNRDFVVDDKIIKAQIWDTPGQERFKVLLTPYYRNCSGAILIYDTTDYSSYESLQSWLSELRENAPNDIIVMIVGNKCDLKDLRAVPLEDVKLFAEQNNFSYIETSAFDSTNVEMAFQTIVKVIYHAKPSTASTDSNSLQKAKTCCVS